MTAFLMDLNPGGGLCRLQLPDAPTGASVSTVTDRVFLTSASGFAEFAGATGTAPYRWHSGERLYERPVNFSAGIVDAVGAARLKVYAGGQLRVTVAVEGYTSFRLPAGQPAYAWSLELEGTAVVREVALANGFMELRQHG